MTRSTLRPHTEFRSLVWLKKDLRILDHRPLSEAAARGSLCCLYVVEDEYLKSPEYDSSQLLFALHSALEMKKAIEKLGGEFLILEGSIPQIFEEILNRDSFSAIFSHEETGLHWTFERDKRVKKWCRANAIEWNEYPQFGVVRGLKDRDSWQREWEKRMRVDPIPEPAALRGWKPKGFQSRDPEEFRLISRPEVQIAGEAMAHRTLQSFLKVRGRDYQSEMSSPVTAFESCSRLSPYFSFGNLSIRSAFHEANKAYQSESDSRFRASLRSFIARLHWHCHFIQKLESEPEIEFQNMNRAFDGLREDEFKREHFQAWCEGQTGYPLVDACMRALHRGGWINFRMRAMLASFSAYHLWLHWREPAVFLARQFLDFEPGIHFSQFQMQSGVTGINSIRIYSPIKQVLDQDPNGVFIRKYLPELEAVPAEYLAEPHKMPILLQLSKGIRIGKDYPAPIVPHEDAYRLAKERIWQWKKRSDVKAASAQVYQKHGSRKRTRARRHSNLQ